MNTITQETLHHILPGKIAPMVEMYANDNQISSLDALRHIYRSQLYSTLEKEETKFWHYGPVALYQELIYGITL